MKASDDPGRMVSYELIDLTEPEGNTKKKKRKVKEGESHDEEEEEEEEEEYQAEAKKIGKTKSFPKNLGLGSVLICVSYSLKNASWPRTANSYPGYPGTLQGELSPMLWTFLLHICPSASYWSPCFIFVLLLHTRPPCYILTISTLGVWTRMRESTESSAVLRNVREKDERPRGPDDGLETQQAQ
ncbi:unnamed protein product, partial [Timema podura]|nr:unnamed protein product [Timema podura]